MPREIWTEGRVVGYSAYEIYVKHFLEKDPDKEPASEQQWLASSIGNGSAMLLKLPTLNVPSGHTTGNYWFYDIAFPAGSKLVGSNTIYASFFLGQGHYTGTSCWADRVTNYSYISAAPRALKNDSSSGGTFTLDQDLTTTDTKNHNFGDKAATASAKNIQAAQLKDYMSIVDAVILQPGTWTDVGSSTNNQPKADLTPNFTPDENHAPVLRLVIQSDTNLTHNPEILLTGFTIGSVIEGVSGTDGSTDTNNPDDGDFLGPAVFPWAAKVVLTVPSIYSSAITPGVNLVEINHDIQATGDNKVKALELNSDISGRVAAISAVSASTTGASPTVYTTNGTAGKLVATGPKTANYKGGLTWALLYEALANNKSIDVIADIINSTGTGISVTRSTTAGTTDGQWTINTNLAAGTGILISGTSQLTVSADIGIVLSKLNAGPGISIGSTGSGTGATRKISANLAGGNGISVTGSTDGGAKTITSNIVAGSGIKVAHNSSSHTYTISNPLADDTGWGPWLQTTLDQNSEYTCYEINNFYSGDEGNGVSPMQIGLRIKEIDRGPGQDKGYMIRLQGTHPATTSPSTSYSDLSNADFTRNGVSSGTGFFFYHSGKEGSTVTTNGLGRATVLVIKIDKYTLYDGQLKEYNFTDTSDYDTGLWNIRVGTPPTGSNVGGSWGAHCKAFWIGANYGDATTQLRNQDWLTQITALTQGSGFSYQNTDRFLVVRADSYIDGYNTQLSTAGWCPNSGTIFSSHINLNISGQLWPT